MAKPTVTIDLELYKLGGVERVREMIRREKESHGAGIETWGSAVIPYLEVLDGSSAMPHPRVDFAFTVQMLHCNRLGNLHGGCAATLFDYLTSVALVLVSEPGFWLFLGVSRTLNVTYLRPMPAGETFHFECEIVHIGKRLAQLKGVARRPSDGAIMAVCEHGKVNTDPALPKA